MIDSIRRLLHDESGQVTIEWAVLAVGMGSLAVVIVIAVGDKILDIIEEMLRDLAGS